MAQRPPTIACEDVPLDEARKMSRGPLMDPELYHTLKEKIQSLDNAAARMAVLKGINPATMKNHVLRVAAELNVPVTVRKFTASLIFWRSSDDDLQQAKEVATRLESARQPQAAARRGHRRPT